ncbi:MAG: hypothetical protein DCC55_23335 [Chloroflexi bacterium]|nr:MAG: hypothetical protein DCC55_23335 [Chloroflexota bacterium]
MQKHYSLLNDPLFYGMLAFFALLTTGSAAALGQPRFLPISQTAALFAFLTVAMRRQTVRAALLVLAIWLVTQVAALILVTRVAPGQVEQAIGDGFTYRTSFIAWFYGAGALPASLGVQPGSRILELIGVSLGSLLTGGLVGVWSLVRAANLAAYGAGVLWQDSGHTISLVAGLPIWTLLRLAGYAGLVVLLAAPLFSGNWSPRYYLTHHRRLLVVSTALLLLGLLLEFTLPGAWRALFT